MCERERESVCFEGNLPVLPSVNVSIPAMRAACLDKRGMESKKMGMGESVRGGGVAGGEAGRGACERGQCVGRLIWVGGSALN